MGALLSEEEEDTDDLLSNSDLFVDYCQSIPADVRTKTFLLLHPCDLNSLLYLTNKSNHREDFDSIWQKWCLERLGWELPKPNNPCSSWRNLFILLWKFDPYPFNGAEALCTVNDEEGKLLFNLFSKFATDGIPAAQYHLGTCYQFPIPTVQEDEAKARIHYELAANAGNLQAAHQLGHIHEITEEYQESLRWYLLVSQGEGNPEADNSIGWFYENGYCVLQDYKMAMKYFQKGSARGNPKAATNIGWLYHNGWGVRKNFKKAMEYYLIGWDRGNLVAATNIAWIYADGLGVPVDLNKAYYYYKVAADGGNSFGQNGVGWCYHLGCSVEKNLDVAEKYYNWAAAQGDPRAPQNLIILERERREEAKKNEKKDEQ